MDLTYRIEAAGDREKVVFSGNINEDAEVVLATLASQLKDKLLFNLKNVENINSCGVRAWVNFMRAAKSKSIVFTECPPEVVSQMNMIPDFKGHAVVQSVYGPYTCEQCGNSQNFLFEKGKSMPNKSTDEVPQPKCPKCRSEMEMDELEEEYFSWLET